MLHYKKFVKMVSLSVCLLAVSSSLLVSSSKAADYTIRHIYSKHPANFIFEICNTHHDCSEYPVPSRGNAGLAIPDDVLVGRLYYRGSTRNQFVLSVRYAGGARIAQVCTELNNTIPGAVKPNSNNCASLDNYYDKFWITVNNPADGDIKIQNNRRRF